ncbi:hypothetical protein N7466_003419 [Penicillium verhagenii]|uniref:uncharacterized protein n=1 Tax=Penicillium verhagenii TaxID=1562060 RepID=UPI0025454E3B|nr:uncharacterized protein N7466_003419 [Penicillium verhagenii]KAJ5936969.1 hypothetical protein N7466_003419 [Penicillium verhagenii]
MTVPSHQPILHAYRSLYRGALKAIRYSTPARHVLRSTMRNAFRSTHTPTSEFDPSKIANTLLFLERAADVRGLEHKIVKNLMLARYWEQPHIARDSRVLKVLGLGKVEDRFRKKAYEHYNLTLERLNESLGTCLK